jgi:hypothetical protein
MSVIRREFVKTLFQKRTYIGWAGLFLVPFLITIPSASRTPVHKEAEKPTPRDSSSNRFARTACTC